MQTKTFYHVTTVKHLPQIQKEGLRRSHQKNVGISKNVNYVMDDLFSAGVFASKMGWEMKEPIVILHMNLDVENIKRDENIGAYSTWYEYHADISPSQITMVERADEKFWRAHQRRMSKRMRGT